MKFTKLIGGGLLATVLALGVGAGLAIRNESKEVRASDPVSGKISLDVTQYWCNNDSGDGTGQHYAVYFYEGELNTTNPANSGWSSYVFGDNDIDYIEVSYNLSFTPNYMIAVRYSNWLNESDWSANPWRTDTWGKWNQTQDIAFVANGHINVTGWNWGEVSYAYVMSNYADPAWGNKMNLTGVQLNASNHCEYYSDSVSLTDGEKIKVVYRGGYYGNGDVRISDLIESGTFTYDGDGNIECHVDGVYSIYFDVNATNTGTNYKVYITDPALAAADKFAQSFLTKTTGYCTASIDGSVLTALKGEYDALASVDGAQKAFYESEVKRGQGQTYDSYSSEALSRYVNMQEDKGYTDFLGLGLKNPASSRAVVNTPFGIIGNDNSTAIMVVVIVAVASLTAIGGYFFIRRRREN